MAVNRMGPPCPECGCLVSDITRTNRSAEGHFWRRRDCPSCGHHFQTVQHAEIVAPRGTVSWRYRTVQIKWANFRNHFTQLVAQPHDD
jgi:transcriptional regulator NrdR family protein